MTWSAVEIVDHLLVLETQHLPSRVRTRARNAFVLDTVDKELMQLDVQDAGDLIQEPLRVRVNFGQSSSITENTNERRACEVCLVL